MEDLERKVDDFKNERNLESGDHRNRDTTRHRGVLEVIGVEIIMFHITAVKTKRAIDK
ncbi:hypothetical protein DPMN_077733 [Dreissena polymorpha]|uniref:Uncharacterized protein n=1 Tax=Dreissena polymorpha TaxID=45954 RepID=A0A9D4BRL6_DREPO|nr:hypothetical protein DPMN_077733 [Dreissena polymorpha]